METTRLSPAIYSSHRIRNIANSIRNLRTHPICIIYSIPFHFHLPYLHRVLLFPIIFYPPCFFSLHLVLSCLSVLFSTSIIPHSSFTHQHRLGHRTIISTYDSQCSKSPSITRCMAVVFTCLRFYNFQSLNNTSCILRLGVELGVSMTLALCY